MRWAALAAALSSGCAVAAGTSVGQARARRAVDSTACIQAPTGDCVRTVAIGRDLPARRFGGGLFAFGDTGYAQLRRDGDVRHGAIIDGYYEYFRGRGRWAVGGRVGVQIGLGFANRFLFMVPVTAIAHVGGAWGSVYVGAGYAPVATESQPVEDPEVTPPQPAIWHHDSVHALVGTRITLRETLSRSISINPELRAQIFGGGALVSVTANVGLHF